MQSSHRTRQPLSEIVLDTKKAVKRPLSPSPLLLSPSKRRILAVEGFPTSPRHISKRASADILVPSSTRKTSTSRRIAVSLTESSRIPAKLPPPPEITSLKHHDVESEHRSAISIPPLVIPREMPSTADRQSAHWPGFDVHCDSHLIISTSASESPDQTSTDSESDSEKFKENLKPPRITSKRRETVDDNPFQDNRPSPKVFSPSSIFSVIHPDADEEAAVDKLL